VCRGGTQTHKLRLFGLIKSGVITLALSPLFYQTFFFFCALLHGDRAGLDFANWNLIDVHGRVRKISRMMTDVPLATQVTLFSPTRNGRSADSERMISVREENQGGRS
jgi:hypothetical protein